MRHRALPLLLVVLALQGCGQDLSRVGAPTSPEGVTWSEDYACDETPLTCSEDYLRLARELAPGADLEACRVEQIARVQQLSTTPMPPRTDSLTPEELRGQVLAALAIEPWLQGLDERPLDSRVVARNELPAGVEQVIRLKDPHIGTMRIRLIWPRTAARPLPAVIALPGHPENAWAERDFLRRYGGALVEAGFLVAIPSWRAYDGWTAESEATTSLLCAGSSLLAVRQYEILLVDKLLRWLRAQDKVGRVGLLAHSGGSVAGNLLVRHHFSFDALVSDMTGTFAWGLPCESEPDAPFCVQEETDLEVHPLRDQVQSASLVPERVPVLRQRYGYPEGLEPAISFLREHLVDGSAGAAGGAAPAAP